MAQIPHELPAGPKLNLGCGPVQPAGWVNIDASHRARLASVLPSLDRLLVWLGMLPATEFNTRVRIYNLCRPLPYGENTVAAIYAGELWEHFEYDDAARLTRECFRVLAPGGVLRLCVPDGQVFWREYLALLDEALAKPREDRDVQPIRDRVGIYFENICTRKPRMRFMGHFHKWQYDEVQLIDLFESCGFSDVERMAYRHSRIDAIDAIERWDFLIVEGVKSAK